jgi:hypothetical protein
MGLIECPDCEGKVSDIAPSCPHCGRPFEANVKEPAAATPSQDGFKNSATENVFNLIWEWVILQKKIWKYFWRIVGLVIIGFSLIYGAKACVDDGPSPLDGLNQISPPEDLLVDENEWTPPPPPD